MTNSRSPRVVISRGTSRGGLQTFHSFVTWAVVAMAVVGLMHFVPSPAFADDLPHSEVPAGNAAYPVTDSGVWGDALHDPKIFWIDNHRVLFKNAEFQDKGKALRGRFNIAVWDTRTNKVTPYTNYAENVRLCFADGYLSYVLYDDKVVRNYAEQLAKGRIHYFAGPFGKEERLAVPASRSPKLNEFSCRFITDLNHLVYRKDRLIKLLKDEHGYIDYGPRAESLEKKLNAKYSYVAKGNPDAYDLPILRNEFIQISYHDYKGAYFILSGRFDEKTPTAESRKAWWLYPTGEVEEMEILPHGDPNQHWGTVFPLRDSFFVGFSKYLPITDEDRKERKYFSRQIYRFIGAAAYRVSKSGKVEKVISGHIASAVVSPDGCKVAFVHYEHRDATLATDPRPVNLKSITFCREGKNK